MSSIPQSTPLNPYSKLSYPYLLTPSRMPLSTWAEILEIFPISRSKQSFWRLEGGGVRILSKRELKIAIWGVGRGWRKGGDISSYPASYPLSWDICTRKSSYIIISLFIWGEANKASHSFVHQEGASLCAWGGGNSLTASSSSGGNHHHWGGIECVGIEWSGD